MRSNLFSKKVSKKLFTKKKGDRSRPWYTPGNKREKPAGRVAQCVVGSSCSCLARLCGYDPTGVEGRCNVSIPSLQSAGCVWLEHIVPGPRC
jgi:hypothetical protein